MSSGIHSEAVIVQNTLHGIATSRTIVETWKNLVLRSGVVSHYTWNLDRQSDSSFRRSSSTALLKASSNLQLSPEADSS